ncbi:cell growth-regulating nucleolar protein, partial [Lecanoromycetidae sp. Uapishka_2]
MVSLSQNCGDVLTKKKLDPHHRQCQGSSFTCLDCMTHFRGTDYRTHTSCVSEAQKYQGALYKEKPTKEGKKSVKISESASQKPRRAYVEDVADSPTANTISVVHAPPPAPTPPSAIPPPAVNVFDFLVTGDTPNASKVSLAEDSMKMVVEPTPAGNEAASKDRKENHGSLYEKHGYEYGSGPVPLKNGKPESELYTPAPKHSQNRSRESVYGMGDSQKKSTDKKRKRLHVEELDLSEARRPSQERDLTMSDAPPVILHSGLTGGLNRLLSNSEYPPTPDYSNLESDPLSPAKRSRKTITITNETFKDNDRTREKERGRKATSHTGQLVRIRKRRSSDESRPHKQHRSHHSPDSHSQHGRPKHKAIEDHPKRKAIEYHNHASTDDSQKQVMVIKSRAELFMSFVTKGPESEQGYSVHKALKRYHRERDVQGLGLEKESEEKELFKGLRLRRNERGEVVVFF